MDGWNDEGMVEEVWYSVMLFGLFGDFEPINSIDKLEDLAKGDGLATVTEGEAAKLLELAEDLHGNGT